MGTLDASIAKLDSAVQQKLSILNAVTSVKEIRDINRFLKESQRLKKTLYSMGPAHEICSSDALDCIEENEDFNAVDVIIEGCNLIVALHAVVNYDIVKETQSEWLLDDVFNYINALREAFGRKIPALPGSEQGRKE